ncbi:MAG TPA: serine hydrolase [Pyrinomonadaceae bacterium]|nr:serine hydrolase [Pyrinomonadaceae bacterium]
MPRKSLLLTTFLLLVFPLFGQGDRSKIEIVVPKDYRAPNLVNSPKLEAILKPAVEALVGEGAGRGFKAEEIAATLIDLRDPSRLAWASVNGERQYYPASVPKMFYMAALQRQLEDGKILETAELARGEKDMVVDSSNDATQYIVDVLTDTASGSELPQAEFDRWQYQRNRMNRYFSAMGYTNINLNQKIYCEDAYGIEQQSRNYKGQNRNMLTTFATARMLAEIVLGRLNTTERTKLMMDLLKREPFKPSNDPDNQAVGFTGKALIDLGMKDAKLWSKAGWTSRARHDAAYIETPDGLRFVLVVFTENHANDRGSIGRVASYVLQSLKQSS